MLYSIKDFYPFHRFLTKKYHINLVLKEIIKLSHGKVLDIGCGEKPFYKYVKQNVDQYIGLDHPDTPHSKENIDVFSTAYSIPFESDYFDIAILTQVIEHLEEPQKAFQEINRALKNNGILIVAWPFLFPIHEAPRDFYRYTSYGMKYIAESTNFDVKKIVPVSGFWITFFGLLSHYIYGKSKYLYFCLSPLLLLLFLICILFNALDKNQKSKGKWTWNYYAILTKKG